MHFAVEISCVIAFLLLILQIPDPSSLRNWYAIAAGAAKSLIAVSLLAIGCLEGLQAAKVEVAQISLTLRKLRTSPVEHHVPHNKPAAQRPSHILKHWVSALILITLTCGISGYLVPLCAVKVPLKLEGLTNLLPRLCRSLQLMIEGDRRRIHVRWIMDKLDRNKDYAIVSVNILRSAITNLLPDYVYDLIIFLFTLNGKVIPLVPWSFQLMALSSKSIIKWSKQSTMMMSEVPFEFRSNLAVYSFVANAVVLPCLLGSRLEKTFQALGYPTITLCPALIIGLYALAFASTDIIITLADQPLPARLITLTTLQTMTTCYGGILFPMVMQVRKLLSAHCRSECLLSSCHTSVPHELQQPLSIKMLTSQTSGRTSLSEVNEDGDPNNEQEDDQRSFSDANDNGGSTSEYRGRGLNDSKNYGLLSRKSFQNKRNSSGATKQR